MKEKRSIRKQILISPELSAALRMVSNMKELSENEIINRAIVYYLQRFKNKES